MQELRHIELAGISGEGKQALCCGMLQTYANAGAGGRLGKEHEVQDW